jgi:hypothetical protein
MTFDPFTNRVPFGLLADEEKAALQAQGPWEFWQPVGWREIAEEEGPGWFGDIVYRAIKPAPVDDWADWDRLHVWAQFVARDEDGAVCCYTGAPDIVISVGRWINASGSLCRIDDFPGMFRPGNRPWNESLIQRPEARK